MKSKTKNAVLAIAGLMAGLVVGGEALACTNTGGTTGCTGGDFNWSLDKLAVGSSGDANGYGNSYTGTSSYGGSSIGLTVTAYSDTGSSSTLNVAKVVEFGVGLGLGVKANSADSSLLDIVNYKDSLLFSFSSAITLNTLTAGYINLSPAEFSIYQYKGGDATLVGKTYGGLLSSWELVQNSSFTAANSPATVNSPGNLSSSKWLIAANNTTAVGAGNYQDAMKLLCIGGDAGGGGNGKVSEPSGLLLLGTAAIGMFGLRRREKGVPA